MIWFGLLRVHTGTKNNSRTRKVRGKQLLTRRKQLKIIIRYYGARPSAKAAKKR